MNKNNKDKLKQIKPIKPRKRELINAIEWHCDTVYMRITIELLAHWGAKARYLENAPMKRSYEIIDKQHIDIIIYVTETRAKEKADAAQLWAARREIADKQEAKTKQHNGIIEKFSPEALEEVRVMSINAATENFIIDNADEIKIATEAIKDEPNKCA
jgi:hypothetical protein